MKPGTDRLGLLLHDAARAVRKRFERRTAGLGLSSAQWRMLLHVCREGCATQTRLADLLDIEPISVSRLLDRMQQAGWVRREPDLADRRVRLVRPTPKALHAYDDIRAIGNEVDAEAMAGLSQADRAVLVAGLNLIVANLSDGEAPESGCTPGGAE